MINDYIDKYIDLLFEKEKIINNIKSVNNKILDDKYKDLKDEIIILNKKKELTDKLISCVKSYIDEFTYYASKNDLIEIINYINNKIDFIDNHINETMSLINYLVPNNDEYSIKTVEELVKLGSSLNVKRSFYVNELDKFSSYIKDNKNILYRK